MEQTNNFLKYRSGTGCIKAAYDWCMQNYKYVLHRTWLSAVASALVISVFFGLSIYLDNQPEIKNIILLPILPVLMVVVSWFYIEVLSCINGWLRKLNAVKFIKLLLLYFGAEIVLILLFAMFFFTMATSMKLFDGLGFAFGFIAVMCILVIAMLLLMVPFGYSVPRYFMVEEAPLFSIFGKNYRIGMRHYGFIFSTLLLFFLLFYSLALIAYLPVLMSVVASVINSVGMSVGDPSGIPLSALAYIIPATFVSYLVVIFLSIFMNVGQFYIYGSVEAREQVRLGNTDIMAEME